MRRSRTPTTAWPAVADLMTIFGVVGLFAAAAVVAGSPDKDDPPPISPDSIAKLQSEIENQRRVIAKLQSEIENQRRVIDDLRQFGFVRCWPGGSQGKLYFFTYDVTRVEDGYTVSRHADFETGIGSEPQPSARVAQLLRDVPLGRIGGPELEIFGRRVTEAARGHYASDCKLAVTINPEASGLQIQPLQRAGFFPVWR